MTTTFTTKTELESHHVLKCVVSLPEYEGKVVSLTITDIDTKENITAFLDKKELFEFIETINLMYKVMKD